MVILTVGFHKLSSKDLSTSDSITLALKEWCINRVIALGSAVQAMEGHQYDRCMHLHKELFDELVQFRFEKVKGYLFLQSFGEA